MQNRISQVFYGNDLLPYKDIDRKVHYPIANGNSFVGENNVSTIRFYVDKIGGISGVTWVANIKKPNGSLVYRVLDTKGVDDKGEYVDLSIAYLYTNQVGACFIGLEGYSGEINVTEEDDEYIINGTPDILTTGCVKYFINYTPQKLDKGETITPSEYQTLLALISGKADLSELDQYQKAFVNSNVRFYVSLESAEADLSNLADLQFVLVKGAVGYDAYQKQNGALVLIGASGSVESVNGKTGQVVLNATDIKLTTNQQTIQENITRIDENADELSQKIDEVEDIALGGSKTYAIDTFSQIIGEKVGNEIINVTAIGSIDLTELKVGNEIKIREVGYSEYWVSQVEPSIVLTENEVDLKDYAKKNGYYEEMRVGQADNITTQLGINETAFYNFRSTGGSADVVGKRKVNKILGNSVVFNQLVQNGNFADTTHWTFENGSGTTSNNVLTLTRTLGDTARLTINQSLDIVSGHKYLLSYKVKVVSQAVSSTIVFSDSADRFTTITLASSVTQGSTQFIGSIFTAQASGNTTARLFRINGGTIGDKYEITNVMFIDLTLMFGSGKEPTTYADFIALFPKPYYPYNVGEIKSCQLDKIVNVGYNALNDTFEIGAINSTTGQNESDNRAIRQVGYTEVVGGKYYSLEQSFLADKDSWQRQILEYDADKNYLGIRWNTDGGVPFSQPFSVQLKPNTRFVRISYYFANDTKPTDFSKVCLHLTWSGSRTGFEPYRTWEYELANIELRGALDSHDEYLPNGSVTRKIGTYTFTGNENLRLASAGAYYFSANDLPIQIKRPSADTIIANIVMAERTTTVAQAYASKDKNICLFADGTMAFHDTGILTLQEFKEWLTGKTIYYELATPTTEQVAPYEEIQTCDDYGTESFVAQSGAFEVPVGINAYYNVNLQNFIQRLYMYCGGNPENLKLNSPLLTASPSPDEEQELDPINITRHGKK